MEINLTNAAFADAPSTPDLNPSTEAPVWQVAVKKCSSKQKAKKPPSKARRYKAREEARKALKQGKAKEKRQLHDAEGSVSFRNISAGRTHTHCAGQSEAQKETNLASQNAASTIGYESRRVPRPLIRRGCRGSGSKVKKTQPSSHSHPVKRPAALLDADKSKRNKINSRPTTAARSNDYCVAILTEPFKDLTKEQASAIEEALDDMLDEEISRSSEGTPFIAPAFRGKAFYSEGCLKMWCEDDHALDWLHSTVPLLAAPYQGYKLVVKPQTEIPRRVKAGMLVPNYKGEDLDMLRKKLQAQNPWYSISQWSVYHAERQEAKNAVYLILGIPCADVQVLKSKDRRVAYKLGSIYVRLQEEKQSHSSTAIEALPSQDESIVESTVSKGPVRTEGESDPFTAPTAGYSNHVPVWDFS